jgi:hypothetical protein
MTQDIQVLCRQLKPIYGERIDRLWHAYLLENHEGKRELESVLQMLHAKSLGQRVDEQKLLLVPPASKTAAGSYEVGNLVYNDRPAGVFGLREKELIQHVAIFGRSGSGKTNVTLGLIKQLIAHEKPFLIFDWKRNYRDVLDDRGSPIDVYTVGRSISPIRFNPLIPPPGGDPTKHLKKIIEITANTYYLGEGVMYLLQKAIDSLYRQFGVYKGSPERWPTMADVLRWVENYRAVGREANWLASTLRAAAVLCFGQMGKVINVDRQEPLEDLLKRNVVLELDALTDSDKTFFIESLLLWIHHYRMADGKREQFKHAIIIEEAHHILLKKDNSSKESLMDVVLREIRELGESIILIDQHPSMISLPAIGNTYCTITMNLKHRSDVNTAANCMLLDDEQKQYLGRLPVGYAIVKLQARWFDPFLVEIPLIEISKGSVSDSDLRRLMRGDSADSRMHGGKSGRNGAVPRSDITEEEKTFIQDLVDHPLSSVTERYDRLGLSRRKGNEIQKNLIDSGLVQTAKLPIRTGWTVLLSLTPRGLEELRGFDPGRAQRAKGFISRSLEHEYWRTRVAEHFRSKGCDVQDELHLEGGKSVDLVVACQKKTIAIEIETGKSEPLANVNKCLEAGYQEVISVATSAHAFTIVQRQLRQARLLDDPRVKVVRASAF